MGSGSSIQVFSEKSGSSLDIGHFYGPAGLVLYKSVRGTETNSNKFCSGSFQFRVTS